MKLTGHFQTIVQWNSLNGMGCPENGIGKIIKTCYETYTIGREKRKAISKPSWMDKTNEVVGEMGLSKEDWRNI